MESLSVSELHVLLVEPSSTQRKIIEQTLVAAHVDSMEYATSINEAVEAVRSSKPDLVVSCLHFSDGEASDLVDKIQELHPEILPFILISSESRASHLEYFKQKGVVAILPKPFKQKQLESAIEATLDFINPDDIDTGLFETDTLNVLVVDDSKMARRAIIKVLKTIGIELITEAEDGLEAIQKAEEGQFDVIFSDMNMPQMDGVELTSNIRATESLAHTPVLMVTSEQNESTISAMHNAGVDAVIGKPFEPKSLKSVLSKLLST
ncbi:MAG: response regulator [Pontibacterium sp.]